MLAFLGTASFNHSVTPRLLLVLALAFAVAGCSGEAVAEEVTVCMCATEPLTTDRRVNACNKLITALGPEETARQTIECRSKIKPGKDGPDLCFCLKVSNPPLEIAKQCQAIVEREIATASDATEATIRCNQ